MRLNYKTWAFLLFLSVQFPLLASPPDSVRLQKKGKSFFVIHQVEKGETLYSLSRRYGADINQIISENAIVDNQLSLGQELKIPVSYKEELPKETVVKEKKEITHVVMAGETLYAISRKYGVDVDKIKKWNDLESNELSIGQSLKIKGEGISAEISEPKVDDSAKSKPKNESPKVETPDLPKGFIEYYVQTGDLLESIARKYGVKPDSIVIWNDLPNTYLSIGQKLLIKGELKQDELAKDQNVEVLPYGQRKFVKDQSGFVKVIEEGVASTIEDAGTEKYLALHRTLAIGTLIEVRNLMNNQKIFVRVVGKLPPTGLNENVLIRLTPKCFERLGVIDPKTRVEISYYQD